MATIDGSSKAGTPEARDGDASAMTSRMRQIVQLLSEGVLLVDRAGRIIDLNATASELLLIPSDELLGADLEQLFLGSHRVDGRRFLVEDLPGRRALLSGVPQTALTMGFPRRGRDVLWLEVDAIPLGSIEQDGPVVLVSFRDVSEHRRADEAVRFQAALLDAVADAIIATDRHLRITYCNSSAEQLLQRGRDETIGTLASAFIAPDRSEDVERIEHLLLSGLVIRDFETKLRRADGTDVEVSLSVTCHVEDREPQGAIAIVRDVSDRARTARAASAIATRAAEVDLDLTDDAGDAERERDLTILYIDDDPTHLRAVEAIVASRDGVRLVTTAGGRRGIELAHDLAPDLLLLSASLPDLALHDALAELRADGTLEATCIMVVNVVAEGRTGAGHAVTRPHPIDMGRLLTLIDGLATTPFSTTAP